MPPKFIRADPALIGAQFMIYLDVLTTAESSKRFPQSGITNLISHFNNMIRFYQGEKTKSISYIGVGEERLALCPEDYRPAFEPKTQETPDESQLLRIKGILEKALEKKTSPSQDLQDVKNIIEQIAIGFIQNSSYYPSVGS